MDSDLTPQERLALIKAQLQEILKPEIIEDIVLKQQRPLKIYWGSLLYLALAFVPSLPSALPSTHRSLANFFRFPPRK